MSSEDRRTYIPRNYDTQIHPPIVDRRRRIDWVETLAVVSVKTGLSSERFQKGNMALAILSGPSTWEVKLAMGEEDMQRLLDLAVETREKHAYFQDLSRLVSTLKEKVAECDRTNRGTVVELDTEIIGSQFPHAVSERYPHMAVRFENATAAGQEKAIAMLFSFISQPNGRNYSLLMPQLTLSIAKAKSGETPDDNGYMRVEIPTSIPSIAVCFEYMAPNKFPINRTVEIAPLMQ